MPRLSANLSTLFTELPFEQRFAAAASVGFKGVEFALPAPYDQDMGQLGDLVAANGLTLAVMDAPGGPEGEGIAAVAGRETEFHEAFEQALEWADFLDCKRVNIPVGLVPDEDDYDKAFQVLTGNLSFAARQAKSQGIKVLIEPLNPLDHPGVFLTRPDDALTLLDEVEATNLFILFDVYHAQRTQGGLSDFIEMAITQVAHIRLAGVPLHDEPDGGEINTPYLMSLLDSHGYDGWVGCSYHPRSGTRAGLKWAKDWGINPAR
ncbi:MAG: hydroxypyruvate isomerase [Alphaproteobacteria bacterium RIFOXYD12_FULL_60_8]|nr:MAG: hydroxypyruvate isomerase [Alphaproteobacteria bacterium RIFOXYD12_FULL_60_8]